MRQRTIYEPRFYHDSPFMYYQRVYTSKIDVMTTISVQVGWTAKADTIYGIREYPVQTSGGSSHQIEKLVRQFSSWKLDRRQIQHLLLPLHCFFDVDKQLFYTVSEHAAMTMTLGKMLLGLKQWPYLLLNDDTGAIIHQVSARLSASRGMTS